VGVEAATDAVRNVAEGQVQLERIWVLEGEDGVTHLHYRAHRVTVAVLRE
jgi:hypothetical protein